MRIVLRLHNKGTTKTLGFTFTMRTIKEMVCHIVEHLRKLLYLNSH
jgi:hypothetical protein